MSEFLDIAGQRFGKLVALERCENNFRGQVIWLVRCDCGNEFEIAGVTLRHTVRRCWPCVAKGNTVHGHNGGDGKSPTYNSWECMHRRCKDPNHYSFKNYGALGVKVCARWGKFDAFLADMGVRPGSTTLDRLDHNKEYGPDNCRWATRKQQAATNRITRYLIYDGLRLCVTDWINLIQVDRSTFYKYLRMGCTLEDIIAHFKREPLISELTRRKVLK